MGEADALLFECRGAETLRGATIVAEQNGARPVLVTSYFDLKKPFGAISQLS